MNKRTGRPSRATIFWLLLATLIFSGCGSAESSMSMSGAPGIDFGADQSGSSPSRIISLSPTSTEMLYAIGAGDQVVAVDSYSYFPAEAPVTDLSGWEPNVEAILSFDPDLVLLSYDPGDVVAGLATAQVEAIVLPAAVVIADTYAQIQELGDLTGRSSAAEQIVSEMKSEMADLAAQATKIASGLTYYHELDDTYFSATSSTFIGEIYALAGLVNVADAADRDGSSYGYPQLSAEYLVDSGPDLIFLADVQCCAQTADIVAARPGWQSIPAVTHGRIIELPPDIPSRWGPRIVDLLRLVVAAVADAG